MTHVSFAYRDRYPRDLIPFIDYTELSDPPSASLMHSLCDRALQVEPRIAAICIWPCFVKEAAGLLVKENIPIATVSNFPSGEDDIDKSAAEIRLALADGATEIDLVIPYKKICAGEKMDLVAWLSTLRACIPKNIPVKVIIESGAFTDEALLFETCCAVIRGGADMLKTSTGKIPQGASIEAVNIMIDAILAMRDEGFDSIGLKISGGIREIDQAFAYVDLIENRLGQGFLHPKTFRIGASQLLNKILAENV